jgi:hypothetical protein
MFRLDLYDLVSFKCQMDTSIKYVQKIINNTSIYNEINESYK